MTATARAHRIAPRRHPRPARPTVVSRPSPTYQVVVTILSILAAIVVLVVLAIVVNTQSAVESYRVHRVQLELQTLRQDNEMLRGELDRAASPARLREVAHEHGMVPAAETGYVSIDKGTIEGGKPAEALAPPQPETESVPEEAAGE